MAYKIWTLDEIVFSLVEDLTESSIVTVEATTPNGQITIMGEPREEGRTLIASRVHISSQGIAPNDIGIRNLRMIALRLMEELDYDEILVEGEIRTTGAYPTHRPRPVRFTRSGQRPSRDRWQSD